MAHEFGIGFLEEVKKALFHDDKKGKYDEFIKDIDDFKTCMKDHHPIVLPVQEFKERVNEVLKGHKYLILGFNAYMKHCRIRLPIPVDDNQQRGHETG
jgi:histone deacetylase complex regulatory component SIN3